MNTDDDSDSDTKTYEPRLFGIRVLPTEPWMDHGACRDIGVNVFFTDSGDRHTSTAKAICHSCIHQVECLNYALDHRIDDGVWGGLTRNERRRMRRSQRLALALVKSAGSGHG